MKNLLSLASIASLLSLIAPLHASVTPTAAPSANNAPYVEIVRRGTLIGPDGNHAVTSIDRKWDPKVGVGTVNEAAVTPDGKLCVREANLVRRSDGTIVAKGAYTDFDGRSSNFTETSKRTAQGEVTTGELFDDNGAIAKYETTSSRAPRHQTKLTTVITYADGTKATRVEILAPAKTKIERS